MGMGETETTEYRKVQVLGRSSFAVTLPKAWVREQGLAPGSILALTIDGKGMLHIIPEAVHVVKEEPSAKQLDATKIDTPGALAQAIKACYKIGYDTINIRHPGGLAPESVAAIHQAVESLYGALIVSEKANETTLKVSIDVRTFTVKSLITRMGSFFMALCDEVEKALLKGLPGNSKTTEYRAREVEKIYSLLVRQLVQGVRSQQVASRVGLRDVIQTLGSRMVAMALKDMSRSMFMISDAAVQASRGRSEDGKAIAAIITQLRAMYGRAYDALIREDIRKAAQILEEEESLHRTIMDLEASLPKAECEGPVVLAEASLVWELQNVAKSIMVLAEVAVNRYVEKE